MTPKRALQPPPPPQKKSSFPWILFLLVLFWSLFVYRSLKPDLPKVSEPPKFYSNQCSQDIRSILLSAIRETKQSIYLVMFGLSDQTILSSLSKKIKENIPTKIYYDTKGSANIFRYLRGGDLFPIRQAGLMHQKILVLDDQTVFIGSANMTSSSLRMHDNLVIGLVSTEVAKFLQEHAPYQSGYLKTKVGGQEMELWLLPDPRGHALTEIKKQIRAAKRSIHIALFTFTHPALAEELIKAHQRGIEVFIVIDAYSAIGASSQIVHQLQKANVPIQLSRGVQLLHHKFVCIDEKTLITGSANWTKAALYKNSDCILALHALNDAQKAFMKKLWKAIKANSSNYPFNQ